MFKATIGHSEDVDPPDAAAEALGRCAASLGGAAPSAIIALTPTAEGGQALLQAIAERYPGVPVVGGTATAQFSSAMRYAEDATTVMMFASDRVEFAAGVGRGGHGDAFGSALEAVENARKTLRGEPKLCLCFGDAMRVEQLRMLEGLGKALGPDVPVLGGGMSTSTLEGMPMRQFFGPEVLQGATVVLLLAGPLRFTFGIGSGWVPTGKPHVLTRVEGGTIIEIDDRPAFDIYRGYLGSAGDEGWMFAHHPLAFETPEGGMLLRAAFAQGKVPGSIVVAGDVPSTASVRITEYQRDGLLDAAAGATKDALQRWGSEAPSAAFVVACSTRPNVLGTWTTRESELLANQLPAGAPMGGFYAFGEYAPLGPGRPTRIHNCSIVTVLLGEE